MVYLNSLGYYSMIVVMCVVDGNSKLYQGIYQGVQLTPAYEG